MTSKERTSLPDIPKSYSFQQQTLTLSEEIVAGYLSAVGDRNNCYRELGVAPPLAVAAFALGALLEQVELPAGSLHTSQEIEMHHAVPLNASLRLSAKLGQRSERAGFVISILEFAVTVEGASKAALIGRTTVMAPAGA